MDAEWVNGVDDVEVVRALDAWRQVTPTEPPGQHSRRGRKALLVVGVGALILLVGAAGGWVLAQGGGSPPPAQVVGGPVAVSPTKAEPLVTPTIRVSCQGLSCFFMAVPVAAGDQLSWDFGDGGTQDGNKVRHTFIGMGRYAITAAIDRSGQVVRVTSDVALKKFHRQLELTARTAPTAGFKAVLTSARRCAPATGLLQFRGEVRWRQVATVPLKGGSRFVPRSQPGTYRLVVDPNSVANGMCSRAVSGIAVVKKAPVATTTRSTTTRSSGQSSSGNRHRKKGPVKFSPPPIFN